MDNKIKRQIIEVRNTGLTNMFDIGMVQHIAKEHKLNELFNYLTIHKNHKEYIQFIMTGK